MISSLFGAVAQETGIINGINATTFKEALANNDLQLVDVRTPCEYQAGHIANAVNIDFLEKESFEDTFSKMDKSKPVYLY